MSLKRTAGNYFLAPKHLAPCHILTSLLATLSTTSPIILRPSGALLPTLEAFSPTDCWGHRTQLWSAICKPSSEALLPTLEAFLEPILGVHAWCEVCTTPRDDHTITHPSKHLICKKNTEFTAPPSTTTTTITHIPNSPIYNAPPLLKEKLPQLPWPAVAKHRVPMLDPTNGPPRSLPPPCPPSATASCPPSPASPPHLACTNTDIHKNT